MAVASLWRFLLLVLSSSVWLEVVECGRLLRGAGVKEALVPVDDDSAMDVGAAAPYPVITRHAFANRKMLQVLVPEAPLVLDYHGGPVLTGEDGVNVFVLWYGSFTKPQRHTIVDFLRSFSGPSKSRRGATVRQWWSLVSGYQTVPAPREEDREKTGLPLAPPSPHAQQLRLAGQMHDRGASLGKDLKRSDLALLVRRSLRHGFPAEPNSVVLVLTAQDVAVEKFCVSACGTHNYVKAADGVRVPYAWVGNAVDQCPGMCAWPFAKLDFPGAPDKQQPLVAPNGDAGVDGMVINIGVVLAGAVTNPLGTGFYQGDARLPKEAATACAGTFGPGAYPGWPGDLLQDPASGASHNTIGTKNRKFLLPALWNPSTRKCALAP